MLRNVRLAKSSLKIVTLAMLLSGCVTDRSEYMCPPLKQYKKETQQQAAKELDQLPPNSTVARLVVDYGQLRDACRALK